jgi:hypothetical protein
MPWRWRVSRFNLPTGIVFIVSEPAHFGNPTWWLKVLLIIAG